MRAMALRLLLADGIGTATTRCSELARDLHRCGPRTRSPPRRMQRTQSVLFLFEHALLRREWAGCDPDLAVDTRVLMLVVFFRRSARAIARADSGVAFA